MSQRTSKGRQNRGRGAAAVELALLLPILVMLVFGIIEFGRAYNAKITVTHAAREAARVLALDAGDPTQAALNAMPNLNTAAASVSTTGGPNCSPGTNVSVTVTVPVTYNIPLTGSGTWTVSNTATMRCGG